MRSTVRKINMGRTVRNDTTIWRYLDFSRFVSLVENRAIHFCHVSAFEDMYDGVFNCLNEDDHYDITTNGKIVRIEAASLDPRSADNSAKFKDFIKLYHQTILRSTGVSCWRLDDHESHAMWRVFVKSDEGVAIESTIGRLTSSISPGDYRLILGKVRYIDYANQKVPIDSLMNSFFYKNRYFEHEKELRLLCYKIAGSITDPVSVENYSPLPAGGLDLPVDVSKLIQGIYVSPYAPQWFSDLVIRVVQRYGFGIPVYPSVIALRKA